MFCLFSHPLLSPTIFLQLYQQFFIGCIDVWTDVWFEMIIHELKWSFIHSSIYSFICSFIHWFNHSFIHLLVHSFTHAFVFYSCNFLFRTTCFNNVTALLEKRAPSYPQFYQLKETDLQNDRLTVLQNDRLTDLLT